MEERRRRGGSICRRIFWGCVVLVLSGACYLAYVSDSVRLDDGRAFFVPEVLFAKLETDMVTPGNHPPVLFQGPFPIPREARRPVPGADTSSHPTRGSG